MNTFAIKELENGTYFTESLMIDEKYILLTPEMPLRDDMIKALIDWDFRELKSAGETREQREEDILALASGESDGDSQTNISLSTGTDHAKLREAQELYHSFFTYIEDLFNRFTRTGDINSNELTERIKTLSEFIKDERRYLLRIQDEGDVKKNYLALHTVRSTIISLVIGYTLKLPNHRLIELGVAAALHEIGMLKLPQQLYMTQQPLGPKERQLILTHPILGYNILKDKQFPLSICLAALEHHERENGQGYPRRLTGEKISLYSKIIAVACSYEALTTVRPYKSAKDGYSSMIDLLKNEGKQYDDKIIRSLVYTLSIYPIGLYVLLSNGKRGQVVDVNPESPRFPIVQMLDDPLPDGTFQVMETVQNGIHIARPLTRDEVISYKGKKA